MDIRADQAGIDGEPLGAHQTFSDTTLDGHLEQLAQQVAVAEPAVPVLGERRVIGHSAVEIEPAEPAIRRG